MIGRPDLDHFQAMVSAACNDCIYAVYLEQQSAREEGQRQVRIEKAVAAARKRADIIKCCSPKWRDRQKIRDIYAEARRKTEETGRVYHVDHIFPVLHRLMCGLHVHYNLRVISARRNWEKNNKIDQRLVDKLGAEMIAKHVRSRARWKKSEEAA